MIKLIQFVFSFQFLFGAIAMALYLAIINGSNLKWKK